MVDRRNSHKFECSTRMLKFNNEKFDKSLLEPNELLIKLCLTLQFEVSPMLNQRKLIKFCTDRDTIITAYCPLGCPILWQKQPAFLYNVKLKEIADKYNKTPVQVIRYYIL